MLSSVNNFMFLKAGGRDIHTQVFRNSADFRGAVDWAVIYGATVFTDFVSGINRRVVPICREGTALNRQLEAVCQNLRYLSHPPGSQPAVESGNRWKLIWALTKN